MRECINIRQRLDEYKLEYRVVYQAFGYALVLRTNSQTVIELCNGYYQRQDSEGGNPEVGIINIIQDDQVVHLLEQIDIHKHNIKKISYEYCSKKQDIYIMVNLEQSSTFLICSEEIDEMVEIFAMRLIREHMIIAMIKQGWIMFHAAVVEKNGNGVFILGNKFAGKTSSVLTLIQNGTFRFVTNDKIMIRQLESEQIEAVSFPYSIGIREDIYYLYNETFQNHKSEYLANKCKYLREEKVNPLPEKKYYFTVFELIHLMNTQYINHCTPKVAFIPKFSPTVKDSMKLQYSKKDYYTLLKEQVILPKSKDFGFIYDWYGVSYDSQVVDKILQQFLKLNFYQITHNDDNRNKYIQQVLSLIEMKSEEEV